MYLCNGYIDINDPMFHQQMGPGGLIIFESGHPFCYEKPDGISLEYYWVHFTGYGALEYLDRCGLRTNQVYRLGHQELLCEAFRQLFHVFETRDRFFDLDSTRCLIDILLISAKYIQQASLLQQDHSKMQQSLSYIHQHVSQEISVALLAEMEHLSDSHYRAVFRKMTGLSPQAYILLTKLNYASTLLRQTNISIKEVGMQVGYQDPQYFSRLFRRQYGVSPRQYRQQHR